MQKFWGVNKMYYGNGENSEYRNLLINKKWTAIYTFMNFKDFKVNLKLVGCQLACVQPHRWVTRSSENRENESANEVDRRGLRRGQTSQAAFLSIRRILFILKCKYEQG